MKNKTLRIGKALTIQDTLVFIKKMIADKGYPPTATEIAEYFGKKRGRKYTQQWARGILCYMRDLEIIEITPFAIRGIKLL